MEVIQSVIKTRVRRRPTPEADAGTPRTRQVREVFRPCDLYRRQHFQLFWNFSNHILEFDEILKIRDTTVVGMPTDELEADTPGRPCVGSDRTPSFTCFFLARRFPKIVFVVS